MVLFFDGEDGGVMLISTPLPNRSKNYNGFFFFAKNYIMGDMKNGIELGRHEVDVIKNSADDIQ
ncbi:hypothetical protein BpHYR1_012108 [Brachionus plicatilis]|uniref:Uncharacterized protein n=1 Tax=Brachionus plicatilis TaxID=10195 RepID=A0A3M7R443_BRAPC|nr:hypothetical protein BpHYR1_012108 [Brachionus plicatilis]